jgi:GNAT superfamily N-acetyltransferase
MNYFEIQRQPKPLQTVPFGSSISSSREANLPHNGFAMRRLHDGDLPQIERHLLDLGRLDRTTRFLGAHCDEVISAYVRRLDPSAAIMIGAFASSGRLLGFAEAQPAEAKDAIDIAVTVAGDQRRKGLGKELVARVIELAFATGARQAEFNFDPSNEAIVRLISSLGGKFGLPFGQATISSVASAKH